MYSMSKILTDWKLVSKIYKSYRDPMAQMAERQLWNLHFWLVVEAWVRSLLFVVPMRSRFNKQILNNLTLSGVTVFLFGNKSVSYLSIWIDYFIQHHRSIIFSRNYVFFPVNWCIFSNSMILSNFGFHDVQFLI